MSRKPAGRADKRIFKRTATRTRGENVPRGVVPRGGTRH